MASEQKIVGMKKVSEVFRDKLSFKIIQCPSAFDNPFVKEGERQCFIINEEPEDITASISTNMQSLGSVRMPWRLDSGQWVVFYDLNGGKFSAAIGLTAVGNSELLYNDPILKNIKTVGYFVLSEKKSE